ncbi:MAG: hypothetical protein JWM41_1751 [Gemmatimonadetes bacterium]|nr:hypothetical protein [Gemmatimonadota bacterium]
MPPTIIYKHASNWVDRGEAPNATLRRVLAHFFERRDPSDHPWLDEHVLIVLGMVAADATEIHIAGYLRSVVREVGFPTREPLDARSTAISLWHIAKAAFVRDFAERVLQGEVPVNEPTSDSLNHWIAGRLLSPEELARYEDEAPSTPRSPPAPDQPGPASGSRDPRAG